MVEGTAAYRISVGGNQQTNGTAVIASEGHKSHILLKVNAFGYQGERLVSTGTATDVAGMYGDKSRSDFGQFLRVQDLPLRDGLLGGVLSTAWPLLDLAGRRATVSYEGLKKVDGKRLYALQYKPEKPKNMKVLLYFDPVSFHHVLTVYTLVAHAGLGTAASVPPTPASPIGNGPGAVFRVPLNQTIYRIEEHFSDFQLTDGLTLPMHYELRFVQQLENWVEWRVDVTRVLNNINLDPRNFEIR